MQAAEEAQNYFTFYIKHDNLLQNLFIALLAIHAFKFQIRKIWFLWSYAAAFSSTFKGLSEINENLIAKFYM